MNNANIPSRQKHWLQVKQDIAAIRATNGLGWTVQTYIPGEGWTDGEITYATPVEAGRHCPDDSEHRVYEVLSEPIESPAVAMRRIADKYASDCRKFCMGVLA